MPVPGSFGRFVFALPAPDDRVYVGITDEDAPGPIPDEPQASETEIDFLLTTISAALAVPLTRADLFGTYSGLRPLLDSGAGSTADISRKHQVITSPDGLVTIVGGKLTTYRRMAEDALDAALSRAEVSAGPCRTTRLPLVGAASVAELARWMRPRGWCAATASRPRPCSPRRTGIPPCSNPSPRHPRHRRRTAVRGAPRRRARRS